MTYDEMREAMARGTADFRLRVNILSVAPMINHDWITNLAKALVDDHLAAIRAAGWAMAPAVSPRCHALTTRSRRAWPGVNVLTAAELRHLGQMAEG